MYASNKHKLFTVNIPETVNANSNARLGNLAIPGRKVVNTPNSLAITSRGVVPHITPDVLSRHTEIGGVYMALEDFTEKSQSGTPPIMNCPPRKSTPLHTFTALPSPIITLLAPRRTPAVSAPTGNSDHSISLFTSVGFQPLSNDSYNKYVHTLKPDIAVGLADISYGTPPGIKRIEKMGDRTSNWLDSMLLGIDDPQSSSTPALFAPVLPVDFHSQSEYINHIADDLADSISGLAFYASSVLVDIPETTAISRLPRLSLDDPSSPHHILRQVSLGMDLFAIPFVGSATDSGLALTFQFPASDAEVHGPIRIKPLAIDLSSASHTTSTIPFLANCSCYTCKTHHRAYIAHLLSVKEMLGWVLLAIHNHAVISTFFANVRASIQAGVFEEQKDSFEREYESELPQGTGQRPRARGYHFKSEGKGEPKRNKPAWGLMSDSGDGNVELNSDGNVDGDGDGDETPMLVPEGNAKELEQKGFAETLGSKCDE